MFWDIALLDVEIYMSDIYGENIVLAALVLELIAAAVTLNCFTFLKNCKPKTVNTIRHSREVHKFSNL